MKNMMLITSMWGSFPTFKLVPTDQFCPYNEVIFDVEQGTLIIISKEKKQTFVFLPKLNEDGKAMMVKKPDKSGNPYAQQRQLMDNYYEYLIQVPEEIESFINTFATNADTFNYKGFIEASIAAREQQSPSVESAVV